VERGKPLSLQLRRREDQRENALGRTKREKIKNIMVLTCSNIPYSSC